MHRTSFYACVVLLLVTWAGFVGYMVVVAGQEDEDPLSSGGSNNEVGYNSGLSSDGIPRTLLVPRTGTDEAAAAGGGGRGRRPRPARSSTVAKKRKTGRRRKSKRPIVVTAPSLLIPVLDGISSSSSSPSSSISPISSPPFPSATVPVAHLTAAAPAARIPASPPASQQPLALLAAATRSGPRLRGGPAAVSSDICDPSRYACAMPNPAVVILCHDRIDSLKRSLKNLIALSDASLFSIFVSIDAPSSAGAARQMLQETGLAKHVKEVWVKQADGGARSAFRGTPLSKISEHFRFVMEQGLTLRKHSHLVLLEDDLDVAPDFLTLFRSTAWLLEVGVGEGYGRMGGV